MQKAIQLALTALVVNFTVPADQVRAATYAFSAMEIVVLDPSLSNAALSAFPAVSITIQDSAVRSGSFSAAYVGGPVNFQGDYASLISFNIGNAITVTPIAGDLSTFRANLLFNPDGSVDAGALFYMSDNFEIDLAGSASLFQGTYSPVEIGGGQGFVSGTLTAVPEPGSLILLITGVLGLELVRRRVR